MDMATPSAAQTLSFRHPKRYFSDVDPFLASLLASAGVDVALVIDKGLVKDIALGSSDLVEAGCEEAWRGVPWRETVTPDSLQKVEELLKADPADAGRWRQITQIGLAGATIPIKYTTIATGKPGRIMALGRDLRSVATLQQRLVAMHQDLEREYANLRDVETRYRSLFNALSEMVVIVSAPGGVVSEINPPAAQRLGVSASEPRGTSFFDYIAEADRPAVQRMIDQALTNGRGETSEIGFRGRGSGKMQATAFRQGGEVYAIVRIEGDGSQAQQPTGVAATKDIQQVMGHLPDGLVIATETLRILSANATFLRMVQAVEERHVVGQQLSQWLGRSSAELNMLMSSLRRHGVARNFATVIRDRFGAEEEVEISAVAADLDAETVLGFAIRPISRRLQPAGAVDERLPGRPEEVTSLVGQMPLKDIVRASTDLIEKLCIETALDLSDQSRASAAEILGLSRQGLYSKLKRFKIPQGE